jgi:hypothetical protein
MFAPRPLHFAQARYKGTGPKFIKRGSRVLYRWSDVLECLDRNAIQRTDERRTQSLRMPITRCTRTFIVGSRLTAFEAGRP